MRFQIRCACGRTLTIKSEQIGQKVRCTACGKSIRVKSPGAAVGKSAKYQSRLIKVPGLKPTTGKKWQKQEVRSNKRLIVATSLSFGILGLIVGVALIVFLLIRTFSTDRIEMASSGTNVLPAKKEVVENNAPTSSTSSKIQDQKFENEQATDRTDIASENRLAPASTNDEETKSDLLTRLLPADLVEQLEPAVVRVDARVLDGRRVGSGVFVENGSLIVTNFSVIHDASSVSVTLSNGKWIQTAGFRHVDPQKDLAVIAIAGSQPANHEISSISISTELPRKGDDVIAFGSPMGLDFSATQGVISAIRPGNELRAALKQLAGMDFYSLLGYSPDTNWLQMTAPISKGNAGGPLINMKGELVGINTFSHPAGQHLNFALTSIEVQSVVDIAKTSNIKPFSRLPDRVVFVANADSEQTDDRPATDQGQNEPEMGVRDKTDVPGINPDTRNSNGSLAEANRQPDTNDQPELWSRQPPTPRHGAFAKRRRFEIDPDPDVTASFVTDEPKPIVQLERSRRGSHLAAKGKDGDVYVFDLVKGLELDCKIEARNDPVVSLAFTSGPPSLVTAHDTGRKVAFRTRDRDSGKIKTTIVGESGPPITSMAVSSNGQSIVVGRNSESEFLMPEMMRAKFGSVPVRVPTSRGDTIQARCTAFSPGNEFFWIAGQNGWIAKFTAKEYPIRCIAKKQIGNGNIVGFEISADGKSLVAANEFGQVLVVDIETDSLEYQSLIELTGEKLVGLSLSDNGKLVGVTSADIGVRIYKLENAELQKQIAIPNVSGVAQLAGKSVVFAGCRDGTIRMYVIK